MLGNLAWEAVGRMDDGAMSVEVLAEQVKAQGDRLGKVEGEQSWARQHIEALGRDLADTERRLVDKQEAGFREIRSTVEPSNRDLRDHIGGRLDRMDEHLTKQDEKLDQRTSRWPPAAYIVGSAAATLAVGVLVEAAIHAFGL